MTATLTRWYEERGRHEIFAGGKTVALDSLEHRMILREELITLDEQHELDALGIAKNAREEQLRARAPKDFACKKRTNAWRNSIASTFSRNLRKPRRL